MGEVGWEEGREGVGEEGTGRGELVILHSNYINLMVFREVDLCDYFLVTK